MFTSLLDVSAQAQSSISGTGGSVTTTGTDVTVTTGSTNSTSGFHIFNSSATELLRVQSNGNVGIGTSPARRLHVVDTGSDIQARFGDGSRDIAIEGATGAGTIELFRLQNVLGSKMLLKGGAVAIDASGYVGIGTTTPAYRLHSNGLIGITNLGTAVVGGGMRFDKDATPTVSWSIGGSDKDGTLTSDLYIAQFLSGAWTDRVTLQSGGNVGIGTASPARRLNVVDTGADIQAKFGDGSRDIAIEGATGAGTIEMFRLQNVAGSKMLLKGGAVAIDGSGNVGIGTAGTPITAKLDVRGSLVVSGGDLAVSGNITGGTVRATFQDVAEWVPATGDVPQGTVVVLDPTTSNAVVPSSHAYDTTVAGVVSARPGLLLGEAGTSKAKVATTGRVKVRVDATTHAIHIGDLLVTSDQPGTAMFSEPLDLAGVRLHRPGTLIGKALEPLASGQGEILVLLSLQ